ncbi:MAG: ABC transporter permease [Patescibacteria group bacterium]|jgi:putative ABC transport system permease protein
MRIADLFQETYQALIANKVRSGLTILGIVIGIGSVIAMIAIGQGSQKMIQSNIESLGSNLILVMPGMQRTAGVSQGRGSSQTLTLEDADRIVSEINNVKGVAPELSSRYQAVASGNNTNTSVVGTVASYPTIRNLTIDQGSFISDQQVASMSKVAVIGPTTRDDLFGENADCLGKIVRINGINFTIIGVTKSKGSSGMTNQDDMIFVPIKTAQQFLAGSNFVSTISVQAENQNSMAQVQEEASSLLLERHNISDPTLADFSIMNQSDIVATASSVTNTFTVLLGSVAAISLVVGGIGIMNMMLTTVTERTREIGLRKAVGAKKADINLQFLTESIMLTFIGGVLGVLLGWLISLAVQKFGGITTNISLTSVLLAFGVSALIGIVFGYYPARRAASLNPIEALRYE